MYSFILEIDKVLFFDIFLCSILYSTRQVAVTSPKFTISQFTFRAKCILAWQCINALCVRSLMCEVALSSFFFNGVSRNSLIKISKRRNLPKIIHNLNNFSLNERCFR